MECSIIKSLDAGDDALKPAMGLPVLEVVSSPAEHLA